MMAAGCTDHEIECLESIETTVIFKFVGFASINTSLSPHNNCAGNGYFVPPVGYIS